MWNFFACVAALTLISCSSETTVSNSDVRSQTSKLAYTDPATPSGTLLKLKVDIQGDPARPTVVGATNLPRGTKLNVAIEDAKRSYASEFVDVVDGSFSIIPNARSDNLLPGKYEIVVSSPLVDVQPTDVRNKLGADYENLTGPDLREEAFGRVVHVRVSHGVQGIASPALIANRDHARIEEVRKFYEDECNRRETRQGRPTLTPKAKRIIASCVADFMSKT